MVPIRAGFPRVSRTSEKQFQAQLRAARSARRRHYSKRWGTKVPIRQIEIRVIEKVEELGAEL